MKNSISAVFLSIAISVSACATKPENSFQDPSNAGQPGGTSNQPGVTPPSTTAGLIALMTRKAEEQQEYFEGKLKRTRRMRKWMNIGIFALNSATTATLGFSAPMDTSLATSLGATFLSGAAPVITPGGEPPLLRAYSDSSCVSAAGGLMSSPGAIEEYARINARVAMGVEDADKEREYRTILNQYDAFASLMQIELSNIFNVFYGATEINILSAVNTPQTNDQIQARDGANQQVQTTMQEMSATGPQETVETVSVDVAGGPIELTQQTIDEVPGLQAIIEKESPFSQTEMRTMQEALEKQQADQAQEREIREQVEQEADEEAAENLTSLIQRASFILSGC